MGIILIFLSLVVTIIILPPLNAFMINAGALRKNYQGHNIPIGLGLVLLFGTIPSLFLQSYLEQDKNIFILLIVLLITILVGLIDDLLGNHNVKGLKGHLQSLIIERELTSGALKAISISLVSLLVAIYYWENFVLFFLNFIILILTTNTFNLFDVRPGRAIKVYLVACSLYIVFFPKNSISLGVILASLLVYAPLDFKGKAMLGDTGSNFLGMSLGLSLVLNLSVNFKIFFTILLIILHIYTEKRSLSLLIEKISILRFIDDWGIN